MVSVFSSETILFLFLESHSRYINFAYAIFIFLTLFLIIFGYSLANACKFQVRDTVPFFVAAADSSTASKHPVKLSAIAG
jgi:hypothetical protein